MSATRSAHSIRLADALNAEVTKIRSLPAVWIALAIAVTANTLLGFIAATNIVRIAGQDDGGGIAQVGTLMLAPSYVFIAIAVFAAGTEYRSGQLRISLVAAPNRHWFFAAKLLATAAVIVPTAIVAVLPGFVIQHSAALPKGGHAVVDFGCLVLAYLLLSLIGFGFAFIARTVVAPVVVLAALPILISTTLGGLFPKVVRLLPHEATLSFLNMPADPGTALGRGVGLLVLMTWAVVFLGVAWASVNRRDA